MATDYAGKKTALEARLKALDADAARIVQKRKDTEAQLATLKTKAAAPKEEKATRSAKK